MHELDMRVVSKVHDQKRNGNDKTQLLNIAEEIRLDGLLPDSTNKIQDYIKKKAICMKTQ